MLRPGILAALLLSPSPSHAQWKGEAGAGLLTTSGNSESESFNGKLLLDWKHDPWKNTVSATAINSGDEDGRTAERYTVGDKLDWHFSKRDYLFGAVDWEKDLFGGYRERTAETAGYGRHLLTGPTHLLDVEIGAGARQTEEQDTGDKQNEAIARAGGRYQWKLTEHSAFAQAVKVEYGKSNTFTESITELKLTVVGSLFAALSFTLRSNSDVPEDTKKTDTFTAVNLSYAFGGT